MFEWFKQQLQDNQFLVAAMGGGVFYTVVSYFWYVWSQITRFFRFFFTRTIICQQDEEFYIDFIEFIGNSIKNPRSIRVVKRQEDILSVIGAGKHWFFYCKSLVVAYITQETKAGTDKPIEKIEIVIYAWNPEKIRDRILSSFKTKEDHFTRLYTYGGDYGGFDKLAVNASRNIDTLFLCDKTLSKIKNVIANYLTTDKYERFHIQKKLGIIFHGPPGTGKSSLIRAIATMTNRDVYYFTTEEDRVRGAINAVKYIERPIVLAIEDIDCLSDSIKNRDKEKKGRFSLATLLSFLDGQNLPDDTIVIATTNRISDLDPALIRPGRFDFSLEISPADDIIARRMVEKLAPDHMSVLDEFNYPITQAEIQMRLLEC